MKKKYIPEFNEAKLVYAPEKSIYAEKIGTLIDATDYYNEYDVKEYGKCSFQCPYCGIEVVFCHSDANETSWYRQKNEAEKHDADKGCPFALRPKKPKPIKMFKKDIYNLDPSRDNLPNIKRKDYGDIDSGSGTKETDINIKTEDEEDEIVNVDDIEEVPNQHNNLESIYRDLKEETPDTLFYVAENKEVCIRDVLVNYDVLNKYSKTKILGYKLFVGAALYPNDDQNKIKNKYKNSILLTDEGKGKIKNPLYKQNFVVVEFATKELIDEYFKIYQRINEESKKDDKSVTRILIFGNFEQAKTSKREYKHVFIKSNQNFKIIKDKIS